MMHPAIEKIGGFDKNGVLCYWTIDWRGNVLDEVILGITEDGRVLVHGVEIVAWTAVRTRAIKEKKLIMVR